MGEAGRSCCVFGVAATVLLASVAVLPSSATAQVGAIGGLTGPSLTPPPVQTNRPDVFGGPDRGTEALPFGNWLVYPSGFAGFLYDSNINQRATNVVSSAGLRLVPSLLAETNDGIHKTSLYGMADGRIYFDGNERLGAGNAVTARAGAIEVYQPTTDFTVTALGDYTKQHDLFSTLGVDHSVTTLNPTGIGLSPVPNPTSYNQLTGSATAQKNFNNAFLSFGGSIVGTLYDRDNNSVTPSPDGVVYTATSRGGYWVTPDVYGYVEGALDWRRFDTTAFNSSGHRIVGGFGTDQIGLWRGEVYGGYQAEDFNLPGVGTTGGSVWGGKLYYYPLPELYFNAALNRVIGISTLAGTPASAAGTSTKVTTVLGEATYALAREWSASGRGGFIHTDYTSNPRVDDAWTLGGTITYSVWRNMSLTLDYQHLALSSNVAAQSFDRDIVTLGLTYKY